MQAEICSRCGARSAEIFIIDGQLFCPRCLYGDSEPLKIYPIGVVSSDLQRAATGFGVSGDRAGIACIKLLESQRPFLYKLEDESRITIVYYLHASRPVRSTFSRGIDGKTVGVFASRTPDRLSRLAIRDVELVSVDGTTLQVRGLDAIDGSPVLDIKLAHEIFTR